MVTPRDIEESVIKHLIFDYIMLYHAKGNKCTTILFTILSFKWLKIKTSYFCKFLQNRYSIPMNFNIQVKMLIFDFFDKIG